METKDWVLAGGILVTFAIGVANLVTSLKTTRRTAYVNTITSERIKWIGKLRENVSQFCSASLPDQWSPHVCAHGRPPMILPPEASDLIRSLLPTFTQPTAQRFLTLLVAAVLTPGRRTTANLLRTLRHLAPGHPTDYRRVLSRAPWSGVRLGCALARFLLDHVAPDGPVHLVGDDTVDGHPGRTVYGKARHRDPVRSSHAFTAWRYGHRWVVLAVLVKVPFAARRWALPVRVDLYRTPEVSRA